MVCLLIHVDLDDHQDLLQVCVLDEHGRMMLNRSLVIDADRICEAPAHMLKKKGGTPAAPKI